MAEELLDGGEDTQKDKYLTFSLGKEEYGIEIKYVREIVGLQKITEVPGLPPYIKGIINLRGNIIPVLDVRARFQKPENEYNDRTCTIVIEVQNILVGLIVDTVAEVLSIPDRDVVVPPQLGNKYQNRFVKGIGKVGADVKLLLNCEKLLSDQEIDQISKSLSDGD